METNQQTTCTNCTKPLPPVGYFCGGCMKQFKCKSCEFLLEADYVGCINCGTPKEVKAEANTASQRNINTFRLHETATDRTIEATFSDDVAKDLAETLRDAAAANRIKTISSGLPASNNFNGTNEKITETAEVKIVSDESAVSKEEIVNNSVSTQTTKQEEYLSLIAIAMHNLPSSEIEWIVVYAFYASNYGTEIFSREDIINKYKESNRYNKQTTSRDLSTSIKRVVRAGFINPLQSGYSILPAGIAKAKEIITRTSSSFPKSKNSKPKKWNEDNVTENGSTNGKKSSKSSKALRRLTNINFEPTGKESLKEFFINYKPKNDYERNLLFVHYLQNILEINEITYDHIFSCYDILDLRIPENLPQTIRNTASNTGWIETKNSVLSVTIKGGNQIKAWNKKD